MSVTRGLWSHSRLVAGGRARRDCVLGRARHELRTRVDARERCDPVRVHGRPRPVRRARHRRRPCEGDAVRRGGRGARRLQGRARTRRDRRAAVRRVPHPDRRQALLQHDAARARDHRDDAREGDGRARCRHLGRRLDLQGQRHRALLPLRAARQRAPADLQAVARCRVRRRARRTQGDERVDRRARPAAQRVRREGVLDRREHARRDARGEGSRAARDVDEDRRADHGRRTVGRRRSSRRP